MSNFKRGVMQYSQELPKLRALNRVMQALEANAPRSGPPNSKAKPKHASFALFQSKGDSFASRQQLQLCTSSVRIPTSSPPAPSGSTRRCGRSGPSFDRSCRLICMRSVSCNSRNAVTPDPSRTVRAEASSYTCSRAQLLLTTEASRVPNSFAIASRRSLSYLAENYHPPSGAMLGS